MSRGKGGDGEDRVGKKRWMDGVVNGEETANAKLTFSGTAAGAGAPD